MVEYIARQVYENKINYNTAINRYPEYKTQIDNILIEKGHGDLLDDNTTVHETMQLSLSNVCDLIALMFIEQEVIKSEIDSLKGVE